MMKKTIFFMLCLAPLGAQAATAITVESGNGYTTDTGFTVNSMYIGTAIPAPAPDDTFYAGPDVSKTDFTIRSDGDITVSGVLDITDGYSLGIGVDAIPETPNTINISFGSIDAGGALRIEDADAFTVSGSVEVASGFSVIANTMKTGAINVTGGNTNLTVAGELNMGQFIDTGTGDVNITAGSITAGTIQNGQILGAGTVAPAENMNIKLGGGITSSGSIYNSGTMTIGRIEENDVVNMDVTGVITNDSNDGSLTLNLDSLHVSGGDSANPSFVNKGDLKATIKGETYLEYGFDLSAMQNTNSFHLDTGTLVFGDDANDDAWLQVFANKLDDFYLAVHNGTIDVNDIINGDAGNTDANMELLAESITADSVINRGTDLKMTATDSSGTGIVISGGVDGATAESNTEILSSGALSIGGNVSNAGKMVLNGTTVELAGVSNTGNMEIIAPTNTTGKITITGAVTNNSNAEIVAENGQNLLINAREINIKGALNNINGVLTVQGSDTNGGNMSVESVSVAGGVMNLNSLIGGVDITNGLSVTGGTLNINSATHEIVAGGNIQINGDFTLGGNGTQGAGNVNVAASGPDGFLMQSTLANGNINIEKNIVVNGGADESYGVTFDAANITVDGDVTAGNNGRITFGSDTSQKLTIAGNVSSGANSTLEIYSDDADVGALTSAGKFLAHGSQITATNGAIDIDGGIWFDGVSNPTTGMIVSGTNSLTMTTDAAAIDVAGGVSIVNGNTLTLDSATDATVSGLINNAGTFVVNANGAATFDNDIDVATGAEFTVDAKSVHAADIENAATVSLTATDNISVGNITNSNDFVIKSTGGNVSASAVDATNGVLDITAKNVGMAFLTVGANGNTNARVNINATGIATENDVIVYGNMNQGSNSGALNLNATDNELTFLANSLTVNGAFDAAGNDGTYDITGAAKITGDTTVANGAAVRLSAESIETANINNSGTLKFAADDGINLTGLITNSGDLTLDSGGGFTTVASFVMGDAGTITLGGTGLTTTGAFTSNHMLYQNYNGALDAGDINVASNDYTITTSNLDVAGINQVDGVMAINTSDIDIGGSIIAQDLRFAANPADNWMRVNVDDSVSGGVQFIGLEQMTIGDNYVFNNISSINAAILPYAVGGGVNLSERNYWSTVSLNDDDTLGIITNAADGQAMITVGGEFISDVSGFGTASNNEPLKDGQIGIDLFDIVNQGTAIWLLHADEGIRELGDKIRNLNVNFCNADGSICINYPDSLDKNNGSNGEDLPAYLSMRDTDGDGVEDSIYIVFDPRFGGPVEVFKIQPVVGRVDGHTDGEYMSAGALDNLIAGQLQNTGFFNSTPIEVIPAMFKGTNLATMANELYNRMEYYNTSRDGTGLARFSRLFQPREIEQIAGSVALNEHTNFRSFEDRMFDEFIWNRNRNISKAWIDAEFGMFTQDVSDGKRVDGNRFSVAGGFDWQYSETTIFGLTAHVSNMSSDNSDTMELGYKPGESILGHVDMNVENTNVGLGGYMMKILGEKTRVYGNAFLDMHLFDISRNQNFVDPIDGSGTAFSLISEWGLMHDWLNQYIVGNAYARVGYNFGFSVKEEAAGQDYMKLKSDGYFILTPGYSLIAQKRIYPTSWFQIRPYASIGVEYDVLGAPDFAKYKFAPAHEFTKYDIDIDPLWANIGGGIEFLAANGLQIGVDYRYQYNDAIQLHNIKISGSYRF